MPAAATPLRPAFVFAWAWGFWTIAALLGVLLRWHAVRPISGLEYAYVLHAHSHVAFLGWVFNAFFALALLVFVPPLLRQVHRPRSPMIMSPNG